MDVRRLVRAVALGGLVLLLAGGGVGFALAAGEQADDEQTLTVPAPRPGDRAVYTTSQVIVDEGLAKGDLSFMDEATYEWMPEAWEVDADYRERFVHPLRSTFLWASGTQYEYRYLRGSTYDAATRAVVSETQVWAGDVAPGQGNSILGNMEILPAEGRQRQSRFDGYQDQMGPCGFSLPFHGQAYNGQDVYIQGNCDWPGGLPGFTFRGDGWHEGPRGKVFRFTAVEDTRFFLEFDETSPFPARATAVLSEVITAEYTMGRYFILERTSSGRGSGTYTPVQESTFRGPLEPVALAPRTPWGVDDSDVRHRFPLSQAYAAILAEAKPVPEGDPTASEWLADHPTAYLASATPWEGRDRFDQPVSWWYIVWTDGASVLGKQIRYGPVGAETFTLPSATGEFAEVYDWDPEGAWPWGQHGIVAPEAVPVALPRPADLLEHYIALTGDREPNRYSFSIECADAFCSEPKVSLIVGRLFRDFDSEYVGPVDRMVRPYESEIDHLFADGDGRMVVRWMNVESQEAVFPALVGQPAEAESPREDPTPTVAGTWAFPATPTTATGISLFALVVSALYYFWPTLKGLPMLGMFSRIEPDRVLEHPSRRNLYELVEANPGIHFQELARRSGFGRGQLEHHLRKLQAANLVSRVQGSSYTCFFARGQVDRRVMAAAPLLRSDGGRTILATLQRQPGATSRQLAAQLGLSAGTVSYHVKRLRDAGLLESTAGSLHLTETGRQAGAVA